MKRLLPLLLVASCSIWGTSRPQPGWTPSQPANCKASHASVTADRIGMVAGIALLAGTIGMLATQCSETNNTDRCELGIPAGFVAVTMAIAYGTLARNGARRASQCEAATSDHETWLANKRKAPPADAGVDAPVVVETAIDAGVELPADGAEIVDGGTPEDGAVDPAIREWRPY